MPIWTPQLWTPEREARRRIRRHQRTRARRGFFWPCSPCCGGGDPECASCLDGTIADTDVWDIDVTGFTSLGMCFGGTEEEGGNCTRYNAVYRTNQGPGCSRCGGVDNYNDLCFNRTWIVCLNFGATEITGFIGVQTDFSLEEEYGVQYQYAKAITAPYDCTGPHTLLFTAAVPGSPDQMVCDAAAANSQMVTTRV